MRVLAAFVVLVACAALLFATAGSTPEISSKFKMKADGKYIPAITQMSGFGDSTHVISAVVQGNTIKSAGATSFGTDNGYLVVKQLNSSMPSYGWGSNYNALANWHAASQAAANGVEKDFIVEIIGENDHVVAMYKVFHAKPMSFTKEAGSDGNTYNVFKFKITFLERDFEVV